MPIIQGIKRKNPLDINKNVSIGVAFPLDETNMFKGTTTTKEQVKSNLLNLLLTKKGERVNHPDFGVALQDFLFENEINKDVLFEEIFNQVQYYIPEITLIDTDIELIPDEHTLIIKLVYQFNLDQTKDAITITI
jgi:phage baseplate assembly protein W